MKRPIALLLLAALTGTAASAAVVQPAQALRRALDSGLPVPATRSADYTLRSTVETPSGAALYIFGDNSSTLVVSADSDTPALLGYTDRPEPAVSRHNPAFAYWLDMYAAQIEQLRTDPAAARAQGHRTPARTEIAPLVKTLWDQTTPYNDLCPMDTTGRSVTGCVATAMAQALNYHQWPVKGTGTNTYTVLGQQLTFDYGSTTFDWADMADTYSASSTAAQNLAVATLMYACGVAVDMDYTADESSSYSEVIPQVLVEHFGYAADVHNVFRDAVATQEEWDQTVYDELAAGRPVIYSGVAPEGGHCFICDGYSNGYFHINWGWSGLDDGYFLLSVLDPGDLVGTGGATGSFTQAQSVVVGMQRPQGGETMVPVLVMPEGFSISNTSVYPGETVTVQGAIVNFSSGQVSGQLGFIAESDNGSTYTSPGQYFEGFGVMYGMEEYQASVPQGLPSGTYRLCPAYRTGSGDWTKLDVYNGYTAWYLMTVSPDAITLEAGSPTPATSSVTGIDTGLEAVTVFSADGSAVSRGDALPALAPGIYIVARKTPAGTVTEKIRIGR